MPKKILIAFYTWSRNTATVAKEIAEQCGGDLLEILPKTDYPKGYRDTVNQAKREIREGFLPELKSTIPDFSKYDAIIIGSPNWWSTIAPPVATFLDGSNLSKKTILPFCTHGGGGEGRIFKDIQMRAKAAEYTEGLSIYGSGKADLSRKVGEWLKKAGIQ